MTLAEDRVVRRLRDALAETADRRDAALAEVERLRKVIKDWLDDEGYAPFEGRY